MKNTTNKKSPHYYGNILNNPLRAKSWQEEKNIEEATHAK